MNSGIDHEIKKEGTHFLINKIELQKLREDAEAYNDLMKANAQVVKDNINITKEHQIVEGLEKYKESEEGHDALKLLAKTGYPNLQKILEGKE